MIRCPRRAEVEAAHDGRLDAAARAALAQHQRSCEPCRIAATALASLGSALATLPVPATDALSARRSRNRLLAAFESAPNTHAPQPVRGRGRIALGAFVLAGVAATAVVAMRSRPSVDPPATPAVEARAATVVATSAAEIAAVTVVATSARWSRHDEGGLTRVRLDDGDLELHVPHGTEPHRLIVSLPDAELEDIGTAFHVSVVAGRTVSIVVSEGAVVLRRAGQPAVLLAAGERWLAEPAHPERDKRDTVPREFRDAVSLLTSGRNAAAAAALRGFLARHGGDSRAEDASYLLVLALQRAGDSAAMRTAARAYLQRYPRGFRRSQVEPLATAAP
jgi:hypothetical protein